MELDRDARRILELTRQARTPSAEDKARIGRRLAGALALGATSAHAGSATTGKVVAGALSAKWGVLAVLVVAGVAAYAGIRTVQGGAASAGSATVATSRTLATSAVTEAPPPLASAAEEAPANAAVAGPASTAPVQDVARATAKHALRGTLPEELDLLHDAQSKWRAGKASEALALLTEHRSRFPHSDLAPERDALTVLSLCATNHTAEARRLAQRFLKRARNSPLRTAVEESCGGK
jgi:hypothetical protein